MPPPSCASRWQAAVRAGARAHIDPKAFPADRKGTPYMAPQVLVDVNHQMSVMRDESFGPVVGIMKVSGDDRGRQLMNDSPYGLTAALWTEDAKAAKAIGARIETGTVFMNRCDYLDPPWPGPASRTQAAAPPFPPWATTCSPAQRVSI
jgi:acyl-CoA reductase-like NAD-dependent aldehyde dehydrogenase